MGGGARLDEAVRRQSPTPRIAGHGPSLPESRLRDPFAGATMVAVAKDPSIRIAVVDDDMGVRTGRVSALESAGLRVAVACDHDEALSGAGPWADVDVVLVDAWDASQAWDRFPGVRVVESVRRVRSRDE